MDKSNQPFLSTPPASPSPTPPLNQSSPPASLSPTPPLNQSSPRTPDAPRKSIFVTPRKDRMRAQAKLRVNELPKEGSDSLSISGFKGYLSHANEKNKRPLMAWELSEEQVNKLDSKFIIARDFNKEAIIKDIEEILQRCAKMIKEENDFSFQIPKREEHTLEYSDWLAMPLLKRGECVTRSFNDGRTKRAACVTLWLLHLLLDSVRTRKILTLRQIYYTGKNLFKNPNRASNVFTDICCMLGCTASSLNVYGEEKGSVIGDVKLRFSDGTEDLSCLKGKTIPTAIKHMDAIEVGEEVKLIMVVEKGTMFNFFVTEEIPSRHNLIMVTAYGMLDERTREFLRALVERTRLPIIAIMDPDPYGISIVKTYAKGSTSLAHCNLRLALPEIHWVGISTIDMQNLDFDKKKKVLKRCPDLKPNERKMLENMLHSKKYALSDLWKKRILHMLTLNKKACFEDLRGYGPNFIIDEHIPNLIAMVVH